MSRSRNILRSAFGFCLVSCTWIEIAAATAPIEVLSATSSHVNEERYGEAIREAEAAADRGIVDADLSFNRGLSYLKRAATSSAEPGDLAQAAAGFAEALELQPGDLEAERGLEQARLLIAQDRSQTSSTPDSSNLGILEQVLLALPPLVLAVIAGLGSLTLSLGLWLSSSPLPPRKVQGAIISLVGALLLLPSLALAGLRHSVFNGSQVAVVISDGAEVVDRSGKRIAGRLSYRKGTLLHLGAAEGSVVPLVNFGDSGYIPIERLRFLATLR